MPSGSGAETPCKKVVNASVTSGETLRLSTNDAAFVVNSGSFDKSKVSISSENDECFPAAMARTFSKLTPLEIDSEASKNAEVKKPVKSETDKSGKGVESAKAKKAKQHIFVIKGCKTFPEKLMHMIESEDGNGVMSWLPNGKAFVILNPKKFTLEVLPKYFQRSEYSSFTRKLYYWGFRKIINTSEENAFEHDLFVRGDYSLCKMMRAGRINTNKISDSISVNASTTKKKASKSMNEAPAKKPARCSSSMSTTSVSSPTSHQESSLCSRFITTPNLAATRPDFAMSSSPSMAQLMQFRCLQLQQKQVQDRQELELQRRLVAARQQALALRGLEHSPSLAHPSIMQRLQLPLSALQRNYIPTGISEQNASAALMAAAENRKAADVVALAAERIANAAAAQRQAEIHNHAHSLQFLREQHKQHEIARVREIMKQLDPATLAALAGEF